MKPYSKNSLYEYYYTSYKSVISYINEINKKYKIPLKIVNINGTAAESLIYHLLLDKVLVLFDIDEIQYIELLGDRETGTNEDGEIGGDVVIYPKNDKVCVVEVKSFTNGTGYTNKSINNEKADFWVLCNFVDFRNGSDIIKISMIKNFIKYSTTISIKGNKEKKLKLRDAIQTAKKIGGDDYLKLKDIHLKEYLLAKTTPKEYVHQNGFMEW